MKKRNALFPSITTLAIIGLLMFLSCASPSQRQEGDDGSGDDAAMMDGTGADNGAPADGDKAKAASDNPDAALADVAGGDSAQGAAPAGGDAAKTADAGNPGGGDADLNDLNELSKDAGSDAAAKGDAAAGDKATADANAAAGADKVDDALALPDDKPAGKDNAAATADAGAPAGGDQAAAAGAGDNKDASASADDLLKDDGKGATTTADASGAGAGAAAGGGAGAAAGADAAASKDATTADAGAAAAVPTSPSDTQAATQDIAQAGDSTPPSKAADTAEPAAKPSRKHAHSGISHAPKVPAEAVSKKGVSLNRFYFARKGDNPQTVSQLIYGTPDKGADLVAWNGKHWKPGKVIYYASPRQADDREMRSFYQERGLQPEEYEVKPGDWMSKIAAEKLGSPGSWKEIAVVNGIDRPDKLEKGQKLAVYPANLSGGQPEGDTGQKVAQNDVPPPPAQAQAQAQAAKAPTNPPPPVDQTAPPPPVNGQPPVGNQPPPDMTATPPTPGVDPNAPPQAGTAPPPDMPNVPPTPGKKSKRNNGGEPNIGKMVQENLFFLVIGGGISLLLLALLMVNKRKRGAAAAEEFGDDFSAPSKIKRK